MAVLDLDREGAEAVAWEIDGMAVGCDVADPEDQRRAVAEAARALGGLEHPLHQRRGPASMAPLDEWSPEEWNRP